MYRGTVTGEDLMEKETNDVIFEVGLSDKEKLENLFVRDLLKGKTTSNSFAKQMKYLGIIDVGKFQSVVHIEINENPNIWWDELENCSNLLNFAIANIVSELIQEQKGILQYIGLDDRGIYVFYADTDKELDKKIREVGKTIIKCLDYYLGVKAYIIVGKFVKNINELSYSYYTGKMAAKSSLFTNMSHFVYASELTVRYEPSRRRLAKQAKKYIENNCCNKKISLNDVCSFFHVSQSYFSEIYKDEVGETFVETLTKARMTKAKLLLEDSSKKIYEIAELVGFLDQHYFGTVFKKYIGMTPTEYGKRVGRNKYF